MRALTLGDLSTRRRLGVLWAWRAGAMWSSALRHYNVGPLSPPFHCLSHFTGPAHPARPARPRCPVFARSAARSERQRNALVGESRRRPGSDGVVSKGCRRSFHHPLRCCSRSSPTTSAASTCWSTSRTARSTGPGVARIPLRTPRFAASTAVCALTTVRHEMFWTL